MRFLLVFLLLASLGLPLHAQLHLSLESGLVFSQYNDVRVPNGPDANGTLFSLTDDFEPEDPAPFLRLEAAYTIRDRHIVEAIAAPLVIEYRDLTREAISFASTTFSGANIDGRYEFNTYRLSYRYRILDRIKTRLDLGATILARDARIAIQQNDLMAEDTDLGFVPLLSFDFRYSPIAPFTLLLKGDALVGPQGRAEDIFGGVIMDLLADRLRFKAGYRFIEGGADVDQVYNFAYFHFADVGLVYNW